MGTIAEAQCFLMAYVDDIIVVGPKDLVVALRAVQDLWKTSTPELLQEEFEGMNKVEVLKFCGLNIHKTSNGGIFLNQEAYVQTLVNKHGLQSCRSTKVIFDNAECEEASSGNIDDVGKEKCLASLVKTAQAEAGELNWLSQKTRPDITYGVNRMSSLATVQPARSVAMGKRLLRYLASTKAYGLYFPSEEEIEAARRLGKLDTNMADHYDLTKMVIYTDASFAPSTDEEGTEQFMKSHGGAVVVWGGAVVAWLSKRQTMVALSSAEAELIEAVEGHVLGLNVEVLLQGLGVKVSSVLAVDNTAALQLAMNREKPTAWRTRHLKLRSQALREQQSLGLVEVKYIDTKSQVPM